MKKLMNRRIFLVVLDSFGIGDAKDAKQFGDEGANTLRTVSQSSFFATPHMKKLGFFNIDGNEYLPKEEHPIGAFARLEEKSKGKDTTIGHWEIAGIVSKAPLPTFPNGFPKEVLTPFMERTNRGVLCNRPYSGTQVIKDYGEEHLKTGKLIVYTSADSVFQIAAHENIVPLEELYQDCQIAREILSGPYGVGRVIARPFVGETKEDFQRTANRHDFSLMPPRKTMLDALLEAGYETYGIGKIGDIFAGQGIAHSSRTTGNEEGMERLYQMAKKDFSGLCFVNLVDFDMLYGHRNDIEGYAKAATQFDQFLEKFLPQMRPTDILMVTADHGCDPGYKGTDHTRECIPLLVYGQDIMPGVNLGRLDTYAHIGATILDLFGIENITDGKSFARQIVRKENEK